MHSDDIVNVSREIATGLVSEGIISVLYSTIGMNLAAAVISRMSLTGPYLTIPSAKI